jgi:hypothetical protein
MPALFGGAPVSEKTNMRLDIWNKVVIVLFVLIPLAAYTLIGVAKVQSAKKEGNGTGNYRKTYVWSYIVLSMIYTLLQMMIASVLIYSVTSIRIIIVKYGLSKRVNYRMFIINAVAMGLYALSMFVYSAFFYYYAKTYYSE